MLRTLSAGVYRQVPGKAQKPSSLGVAEIRLGGLPIAVIDRADSAELMVSEARERLELGIAPLYITSANGEVISRAIDPATKNLFLAADMIHADGQALVFASRLLGEKPLPERCATTDLFHDVARRAEAEGISFYMLGGTRLNNARAVQRVMALYPKLRIAGAQHGYFTANQEGQIIADINGARPGILWIGMGVPNEQSFVLRNRHRLTQVGVIKTSGGLFDFLSGARSRAPKLMQDLGFEWLYRLVLEPRRLFMRYMKTNPHAMLILLTGSRRVDA